MTIEKYDPTQAVDVYDPSKANITVTDKALNHFRKQLENKPGHAVRVSVKRSGCTGYSYVLDTVEAPEEDDQRISAADDVRIFVSLEAVPLLQGTEIDFQVNGLNHQLQFNNPNVTDMCGCGESFSVG